MSISRAEQVRCDKCGRKGENEKGWLQVTDWNVSPPERIDLCRTCFATFKGWVVSK